MNELSELEARTVAVATKNMLSGSRFSICDLDKLMQITGHTDKKGSREYNSLSALHCIAWADMGPELASMVREECLQILQLPEAAIDVEFEEVKPSAGAASKPKKSRFLRLIR